MLSRLALATLMGALSAASAGGQRLVTVHGIAYDSLHGAPLNGAFVVLAGTSRSTMSDSLGRFVFDSVAPGTYRFIMQHDVLDSIGMSGAMSRATVSDGRDTVRVAVPSFTTMWRAVCPTANPPADSGMLFGTVRAPAGEKLVRGSRVDASWIDINATGKTTVKQQRWRLEAPTDSLGNYTMCGVPLSTGIRVWAVSDSGGSGFIDVLPLDRTRIARRDLLLGAADSAERGTIVGMVTGDNDKPIVDAQVVTEGVPDTRTDGGGRFVIPRVPVGTQQIEVRAIGLEPVFESVDVARGDTARITVQLGKVNVLDSVHVTALSMGQRFIADYEMRKKKGLGKYMDSTTIAKVGTMSAAFTQMPSVIVRSPRGRPPMLLLPVASISNGGMCLANLFVDGNRIDQSVLDSYHPEDIAAVEVYPRATDTPAEFMTSVAARRCGTIAIWTKARWK